MNKEIIKGLIHKIFGPKISPTMAPKIKPIRILKRRFDLKYQSNQPFFFSAISSLFFKLVFLIIQKNSLKPKRELQPATDSIWHPALHFLESGIW